MNRSASQSLRARSRTKGKEADWENKIYTLKNKRTKQISKQNKTSTKNKEQRKKGRVLTRIRTPHLRLDASSPLYYTARDVYVNLVKKSFRFNAFFMERPPADSVLSLSSRI